MKQETFFFRLEVLSPLHIGCDEDYEPTNFVVDEENKELISFNPLNFISKLNQDEKDEFSKICDQGTIASLLEIFKFMQRHTDKADGRRVRVGDGFMKHYAATLQISERNQRRMRNELNQFRIERTAFQPLTGIPYIPGSAIKGALRTALLNLRKPKYPVSIDTRNRRAGQDLEKTIFDGGSFATDPMRLVKVSDFIAEKAPESRIVYAVNKKKKLSKFDFSAPYQILEVVKPGAVFVGSVTIISPEGEKGDIPKKPVTMQELKEALSRFFLAEQEREIRQLAAVGIDSEEKPDKTGTFMLRVGRHSGAESLTIDGYRNIRIMQGKGNPQKFLDHATTFWLTSEQKKPKPSATLLPFGWISATQLTSADLEEINKAAENQREIEKQKQKIAAQQRQAAEKERLVKKRLADEEKERAAAAQQAREAEATAQKESWETLSQDEKDILIASGDELAQEFAPEQINDLYVQDKGLWSEIDNASPEKQKALARAFKQRWQFEGSWKVKKAKKKQFAKVQKVKAILGEV